MLALAVVLLLQAPSPYIAVNDSVVAFTNVRLIDGTGAPARDGQTLIIRGGKIAAVGPTASTPVPSGAAVRDGSGKVVDGRLLVRGAADARAGAAPHYAAPTDLPRLQALLIEERAHLQLALQHVGAVERAARGIAADLRGRRQASDLMQRSARQ